jgi:hypothetical protein
VIISHHNEFTTALCPEKWTVANGKVDVTGAPQVSEGRGKAPPALRARGKSVAVACGGLWSSCSSSSAGVDVLCFSMLCAGRCSVLPLAAAAAAAPRLFISVNRLDHLINMCICVRLVWWS